jgi:predicted nucleotide-binding protein
MCCITAWLKLFGAIKCIDKEYSYKLEWEPNIVIKLRNRKGRKSREADLKYLEDPINKSFERENFSNQIFVVHGRDDEMKHAVVTMLSKVGLKPVIMQDKEDEGRTLVKDITDYSNVSFAIVLLSPDDMVYQKDEPHPRMRAQPQARQKTILALGFFIGKLGLNHVFVIHRKEENFDVLSDYAGVLYIPYEPEVWELTLARVLVASGFNIDSTKLLG